MFHGARITSSYPRRQSLCSAAELQWHRDVGWDVLCRAWLLRDKLVSHVMTNTKTWWIFKKRSSISYKSLIFVGTLKHTYILIQKHKHNGCGVRFEYQLFKQQCSLLCLTGSLVRKIMSHPYSKWWCMCVLPFAHRYFKGRSPKKTTKFSLA